MYHAVWTKVMLALMQKLPVSLCEWLCAPSALIFYLLLGQQRRVLLQNINALHPHLDSWSQWFMGMSVFRQFALTYLDRLFHLHFNRAIEWDLPDLALLEQMKAELGGVLIFTAHSGNYDIGAALFADKFERPFHVVRVPERTQELHAIRAAELQEVECSQSHLRVHYNTSADSHLGLELCRLLQQGDVVAVQGDRVVMDVSSFRCTHAGVEFELPRGPLILAEVTRCACYPIFLTRSGSCRYRIHITGPFVERGEKLKQATIADRWLSILHPFVALHTDQWFVFEPLLKRANSCALL